MRIPRVSKGVSLPFAETNAIEVEATTNPSIQWHYFTFDGAHTWSWRIIIVWQVRIQLRDIVAAEEVFDGKSVPRNELVVRLQPDEAVYLKANMKTPGLGTDPLQV